MHKITLFAAGLMLMLGVASTNDVFAAETQCAVHYTRTACPGQEATSYKKCDGKASCVKFKKADTVQACQAAAVKSCRNRRVNITKNKVISAKFSGQAIQSPSGKDDFCLDYEKRAAEFNQCSAK